MRKKRRKNFTFIFILIIAILGIFTFKHFTKYNDNSVEGREEILNASLSKGENWKIATEEKIDEYIISAAYNTNNKITLAVFEPTKNKKYNFLTSTNRNNDDIIIDHVIINSHLYDIIWFNGAKTEYAEIVYTIDNKKLEPLKFDTTQGNIIVQKAPNKNYSLDVCYYDEYGNVYQ